MGIKSSRLIRTVMLAFMVLVAFGSVNAAANMVLASQNPDPVSPGNFVYVNVKVSNPSDTAIKDAKLGVIENDLFQVAKGSDKVKDLGTVPGNSYGKGATNFIISKFKLKVSEETPLGLNGVEFQLNTSTGDISTTFDILVEDRNPRMLVKDFSIDTIKAGENSTLDLVVENVNSISVKNVEITLDLDNVDDNVFSVEGGTNKKFIDLIKSGEEKRIEYTLSASPSAQSKPYQIPLKITYEDSLDKVYNTTVLGSAKINSPSRLNINLDSQNIYSQGKGTVSLAVSNPFSSTIKGTRIEIMPSSNYEVLDGKSRYIGDLNPDDFQTMQSDIYVSTSKSFDLKVKATYQDSYNNEEEKVFSVPVDIYSNEELQKYGIKSSPVGGGNFMNYLVIGIVAVIIFLVGMLLGKRRGRKKSQKK